MNDVTENSSYVNLMMVVFAAVLMALDAYAIYLGWNYFICEVADVSRVGYFGCFGMAFAISSLKRGFRA